MDLSLLKSLPLVSCAAGQYVITEGEPIQGIYFLESGEVEVHKGGVLIAEVFEVGAVFGEMSFLLKTEPTATVRATTPCAFRYVDNPPDFFREHPTVALHVAEILARRLDSLARYLVDIKRQFKDRSDHLGLIDEVLDSILNKHPRIIPRRPTGD